MDNLGDRMKRYEITTRHVLQPRTPTIIRVDGKAFHTFTKCFPFPFSIDFHEAMASAAMGMMWEMQNAQIAYHQSDEVSILLNDWTNLNTQQWFGGGIQKMCSVAASTAAVCFMHTCNRLGYSDQFNGLQSLPKFDARVFQLPKEEVCNYFIFRQQDATRNSIQMLGRSNFSHKEMHKKNVSEVQDMLMLQRNINWNDLDTWKKRGACIVANPDKFSSRTPWKVDDNIPIFTADRQYVEQHLTSQDTK